MNRRDLIQTLGLGAAMGALKLSGAESGATAERYSKATKGLPPLKIEKVKAILTAPGADPAVRGESRDERAGALRPGLRHVQPAAAAVVAAVNEYLAPSPRAGTWTASRICGRTPTPAPTGATARC